MTGLPVALRQAREILASWAGVHRPCWAPGAVLDKAVWELAWCMVRSTPFLSKLARASFHGGLHMKAKCNGPVCAKA